MASEVKTLATQTATATDAITAQLGAIQTAANHTVDRMRGIGRTSTEINQIATVIAAAMDQQGRPPARSRARIGPIFFGRIDSVTDGVR